MEHHLIQHGEAPLASGDELTPSLEYTLDEPNPLHADDLEPPEDRQPTPSSEEEEQQQMAPVAHHAPPSVPEPARQGDTTPPDTPTPPGEGSTPEGDNTVTLERQPIYAQVVKKADREPKDKNHPDEEKENLKESDDDDKKKLDESEEENPEDQKKEKEKKKKEKKEKSSKKTPKEKGPPKPKKVQVRLKQSMPKHRSRCIACGCPRCCCSEYCFFPWFLLFLLLQGGPLAVLVLDFLSMNSHAFTIERYIAEWNMEPAVCRISTFDSTDFSTCECSKDDLYCEDTITGYGCLNVEVDVFTYNHSGPIANNTKLWKSEREYVLNRYVPKCFNLDICKIDDQKPWHSYRNATEQDERLLREKYNANEGFVCYYAATPGNEFQKHVAVMETNTSFWDVLLWFFLPLLGILLCWFIILCCLCWYCCPCAKYVTRVKDAKNGGKYQEVENADPEGDGAGGQSQGHHSADEPLDEGYQYDPNAMKEALHYGDDGEFMQAGKWPTSGPAAACDM